MIPYIHVPDLKIGGLTLHPFGILVASGVLIGTALTTRRARKLGYNVQLLNSFVTWMLIAGFIGGHVFDQLFYHWDQFVRRPLSIFFLWEGLSSFGGFLGALIGILLWKHFEWRGWFFRKREQSMPILPYADLVLSVFPIGWMFGRSGCSVVHDHPGERAIGDSFLAVTYPPDLPEHDFVDKFGPFELVYKYAKEYVLPDGRVEYTLDITKAGPFQLIHGTEPRYDLGLLELMFTVVLAICFVLTWRRQLKTGTYVIVTALAYAPVRFVMDFLRIHDPARGDSRYNIGMIWGSQSPVGPSMTPAQWFCVILFGFGLVMLWRIWRMKDDPADRIRV